MNNISNAAFLPKSAQATFSWADAVPTGLFVGTALVDKLVQLPDAAQGLVSGLVVASAAVTGIRLMWKFFRAKFVEIVSIRDGKRVIYIVRLRLFASGR